MIDNRKSPTFDTFKECHLVTGIPLSEIKRARDGGCGGFKGHYVNLFPLLRWLNGEGRKASARHVVDVAAAKEQDLLESAALKKQKRLEKSGELAPTEFIYRAIRETMLPVRQRLMAMPSECANNANPADPVHARKALEAWLEMNLPIMKDPPNDFLKGVKK